MAAWRCMICLVFVALSLKVLLSYINAIHGRSPDFWVYCGIDGYEQDFRVFNSFSRHIKRTHPLYLTAGCPPNGWRTTPTSHSLGQENFGVSVFANCIIPATTSTVDTSPEASRPVTTSTGNIAWSISPCNTAASCCWRPCLRKCQTNFMIFKCVLTYDG